MQKKSNDIHSSPDISTGISMSMFFYAYTLGLQLCRLLAKKNQPPFKPSVVRTSLRVLIMAFIFDNRNLYWTLPTLIPISQARRPKIR